MGNKLFPEEIIDNSSEANFSRHSVQTKLIYGSVLIALVAFFAALPLIDVTVSVKSQGLIKPLTDRNQLVSLVSGHIDELYIHENATVVRGQTVAEISAPVLQEKIEFNKQRQQKVERYLSDLSLLLTIDDSHVLDSFNLDESKASNDRNTAYQQGLEQFKQRISEQLQKIGEVREKRDRHQLLNERGIISGATFMQSQNQLQAAWDNLLTVLGGNSLASLEISDREENEENVLKKTSGEPEDKLNLQTAKYQSSLLEFKQQAQKNIQSIEIARQKYNRNTKLYERDVISEQTYEESSFELKNAQNDFQLLFDQQRNKWQAERVTYQEELAQLDSEQQQIEKEQEQHIIKAPISGTIQNMKGIYIGSLISANQSLAEISPDTSLIAECYVPPKDVGLLKEGMEARFQISAYDYNQWGLLTGTIQEISNDVIVVNEQPVFRVRASLDKTWLELQNGYRGNLKKGMSLLARFKVTERSLFQLLYDNLDDWLNPKWNDPRDNQPQQASM